MAADTVTENWKPVVGFEGRYEVSDLGRVRTLLRIPKLIRGVPSHNGYPRVCLSRGPAKEDHVSHVVHRLVLVAFVGPPAAGQECDHINGDRADARLANLRWVTRSENATYAHRRHRAAPWTGGERNGNAILTAPQARLIQELRRINAVSGWIATLASAWNLHRGVIESVACGRTWASVRTSPAV